MGINDELGVLLNVKVSPESVAAIPGEVASLLAGKPIMLPVLPDAKLTEAEMQKLNKKILSMNILTQQKIALKAEQITSESYTRRIAKLKLMQDTAAQQAIINEEKQRIISDRKIIKARQTAAIASAKTVQAIRAASEITNTRVSGVINKADNMGVNTSALMTAQSQYNTALSQVNLRNTASVNALIEANARLVQEQRRVNQVMSNVTASNRRATSYNNLVRQMENYIRVNNKVKTKGGDIYGSFNTALTGLKSGQMTQNEAAQQFSEVRARAQEAGLEVKTFGASIKDAFGRYAAIGFATTGLLLIKQTLKKMIVSVKELDASLVNLQIATGMSYDGAKNLLSTYSELGKTIGATTVQVADAANAWLRQGYSIEDSSKLVEQSVMLSKLGMLESSEATKYLTSAMKGYKVEVEDVAKITDRLTAVDMEAAVSAGGIAEAMSMTANGARIAGIDMNKLIGIMTAVGEVSQQEMSRVGTTFYKKRGSIAA